MSDYEANKVTLGARRRSLAPAKPTVEPADFHAFFNEWVEATKKTWGHDRTKTLGGSEVFGCIRKAYYSRNGYEKDSDYEESWGATKRGDLIENYFVVPTLKLAAENHKFSIQMVGEDQQTLFIDGVPMSVTPDGLAHDLPKNWLEKYGIPDLEGDCCMIEIKSIDPRVDLAEEKAIHHGQTQIQMGMVRETTPFKPTYAVILYIEASFLDNLNVFIVRFDPKKYEAAKTRAKLAYEAKDPSVLKREGVIDGSCRYCPYQGSCLETTIAAMPEKKKAKKGEVSNPVLVGRLQDLMAQKREANFAQKAAEKRHEEIKEEIRLVLREFGENRAKTDDWSVSYYLQNGKASIDVDAMEADGIDVSKYKKEGNPFEVLRVTFKDLVDSEV